MSVSAAAQTRRRSRDSLPQDVLMLKHFREHLRALSEPRVLNLILLADTEALANEDVRKVMGVGRNSAWRMLSHLAELALLEKKGQKYRATEYAVKLIESGSALFRGAVKGLPTFLPPSDDQRQQRYPGLEEVLGIADEGNESLYSRGRIDEGERERRRRLISALRNSVAVHGQASDS